MSSVTIVKISGNTYYLVDSLLTDYPNLFAGCKTIREFVKIHDIDDYIYAQCQDNKWTETQESNKRYGKQLVGKSTIDDKFPQIRDKRVEKIPPKIVLEKKQKFKDDDGRIIEVEVRGERSHDLCYFKAKDLEVGFGLATICKKLHDKRLKFIEGEHYKYFYFQNDNKQGMCVLDVLFFTHKGLLKLLMNSTKGKFKNYIDWASEILVIFQIGTAEQKKRLITNKMGISIDEFQKNNSLRGCVKGRCLGGFVSCIYLLCLGRYKELGERFFVTPFDKNGEVRANVYEDDDIVYKYGRTDNLKKRLSEHKNNLAKYGFNDIRVVDYARMDPENLKAAEKKLKHLIKKLGCKMEVVSKGSTGEEAKKFTEFTILGNNADVVWERCVDLEEEYRNHTRVVNKEMQELTTELAVLKAEKKEIDKRNQENQDRIRFLEKSLTSKDEQLSQMISAVVKTVKT